MKHNVQVEPTENTREWRLVNNFYFDNGNFQIGIPAGFITDGASIPLGLRWLFPHGGPKFPCAVVHDKLYRVGITSRQEADQIFRDAMIENGVKRWKAKMMYIGLRLGGWKPWADYRKLQEV